METIGRVSCYGSGHVRSTPWDSTKSIGINRLYYIHSGIGGYTYRGESYPFVPGYLYFIPYTIDFSLFSDANEPIHHTYINFELIPPIITNQVLSMNVKDNECLTSAVKVFELGGIRMRHNRSNLSALYADTPFWELCKAGILYLVNQIADANGVQKITDSIVLEALTTIHTEMSGKLSVNRLAKNCYMNPDSFIRRFSRVVGMTPHAYLKNLRLRTAKHLRASGMNLSTIASEVGYADASSLAHALRNEPNHN